MYETLLLTNAFGYVIPLEGGFWCRKIESWGFLSGFFEDRTCNSDMKWGKA